MTKLTEKSISTRELVLSMLLEINEQGKYCHTVLRNTLNEQKTLPKRDRSFVKRLCTGTIERMLTLDYYITKLAERPPEKMKPCIRNLLRMSCYQIFYMDQVPDSAACNEAVKIARKRGFSGLTGFVNGVLRSAGRRKQELFESIELLSPIEKKWSIHYSMPVWILKKWENIYKPEIVEGILQDYFADKKTTIRLNKSILSIEEAVKLLESEGVIVEDAAYLKEAKYITGYDAIEQLQTFQQGIFQIQDESSMFVALAAGVRAGDRILDICAAPGGKALHVAELLRIAEKNLASSVDSLGCEIKKGIVEARDLSSYKIEKIKENIQRSAYQNIQVRVFNALDFSEDWREQADIVIADLPCSGLGVIGRKPDIRYKMTPETQKELSKLQKDILRVAAGYVKLGGTLIYSTCTIQQEENEENFKFLVNELGFRGEELNSFLPKTLWGETTRFGYLQLIPGKHRTDGFFLARLKKIR